MHVVVKFDLSLKVTADKSQLANSKWNDVKKYFSDTKKVLSVLSIIRESIEKQRVYKKLICSAGTMIDSINEPSFNSFNQDQNNLLAVVNAAILYTVSTHEPKLIPRQTPPIAVECEETPKKPVRTFISYASLTPQRDGSTINNPSSEKQPSTIVKFDNPPKPFSLQETPIAPDTMIHTALIQQKASIKGRRQEFINELFDQESQNLQETAQNRDAIESQRKNLNQIKSVANKMQFQLYREDRDALQDASNREYQDYLEFVRMQEEADAKLKAELDIQNKKEQHEIQQRNIDVAKKIKETQQQDEYLQARQNARTEEEYQEDVKYQSEQERIQKSKEFEAMIGNLVNMNEQRESKLLEFVNDHCSKQVERRFERQKIINHQLSQVQREALEAKRELELFMSLLQKPKKV